MERCGVLLISFARAHPTLAVAADKLDEGTSMTFSLASRPRRGRRGLADDFGTFGRSRNWSCRFVRALRLRLAIIRGPRFRIEPVDQFQELGGAGRAQRSMTPKLTPEPPWTAATPGRLDGQQVLVFEHDGNSRGGAAPGRIVRLGSDALAGCGLFAQGEAVSAWRGLADTHLTGVDHAVDGVLGTPLSSRSRKLSSRWPAEPSSTWTNFTLGRVSGAGIGESTATRGGWPGWLPPACLYNPFHHVVAVSV